MSIFEILSIQNFRWAVIAGCLVSLCAAMLGVPLVLRRFSMIGDGLSHIGFGALALASCIGLAPMAVAAPCMVAAAFLLLRGSNEGSKLRGDASVALLSVTCLALGVVLLNVGGSNIDLMGYMFGSVLSLKKSELICSILLAAVVLPGFSLLYQRVFSITFDEPFARATGVAASVYQFLSALFTALTIVLGMRMMGTLLIACLLVFPALTAMRVCRSFFGVTVTACGVSVFSYLLGFWLSCVAGPRGLPTGATIVLANAAVFLAFALAGKILHARMAHK
jgi:zinc transport system permease protein